MKNFTSSFWGSLSWRRHLGVKLAVILGVVLIALITIKGSVYSEEKSMNSEETVFGGEKLLAGGWTIHKTVDKDIKTVLQKAVATRKEKIKYEPVAVASQVVAGMNYCYLCVAVPQNGKDLPFFCSVSFYQDLKGNCQEFKVNKIEFKDYK